MLNFDFCFQDNDPHGTRARLLHSVSPLLSLNLVVVTTHDQKHHEILTLDYHGQAAFRIVMLGSVVTLSWPGIGHKITYQTETLF